MGFVFFVILNALKNRIVTNLQNYEPRKAKAVVTF